MLLLSAARGLMMPARRPLNVHRPSYLSILATSFIDGMATVGGVFASLEGARAWTAWLCVACAAFAGFYSIPVKYARYVPSWMPKGKEVVGMLTGAGALAGIILMYVHKHNEAGAWALLTLGPSIYLFTRKPLRLQLLESDAAAQPGNDATQTQTKARFRFQETFF